MVPGAYRREAYDVVHGGTYAYTEPGRSDVPGVCVSVYGREDEALGGAQRAGQNAARVEH